MRLRRYAFTAYAVVASLLLILVFAAGPALEASAAGRAFLFIGVRIVIIPIYLIQLLLVMAVVALRGGPPTSPDTLGVVLGVAQWILSLLPFILIDWWRARRSGTDSR